jgi:Putative MetA-pathway of phenol degradation
MKWPTNAAAPLLLLIALPLMAQSDDVINADRPGIADGSTTVNRSAFQVEVGAERDDDGNVHTLITPLLLRYGLAKDFELRMETAGYGRVLGFGEDGFNPLSAGFKWHFMDEDTKTRRPSLGFIGRVFPKSGSGVFRSDRTTGDLRLAGDMTLNEKWSLNPNAGVAFGDGRMTGLAALTIQYNVTDNANVFVDGGYAASALLVDAGAAWILGRDTQLDVSAGWRAHGVNAPNVFLAAGISRRF